MEGLQERTDEELLTLWETAPLAERDALVATLKERNLYPSSVDDVERDYGMYPSIDDPNFTQKLLQKREFSETKQEKITDNDIATKNPCDPEGEFELTAVQRFVGRFMSPECPYYSASCIMGSALVKPAPPLRLLRIICACFPASQYLSWPRALSSQAFGAPFSMMRPSVSVNQRSPISQKDAQETPI
jgi:hypothetical protein